jgi:hypothetical protein
MPITVTAVDHDRRVYAAATGPLSGAAVRAHVERRVSEGVLECAELLHVDRATVDRLTGAEVWEVARRVRQLGEERRIRPLALVAAADATYGLLRMYETLTEETRRVVAFRTRAEAEVWLDSLANAA